MPISLMVKLIPAAIALLLIAASFFAGFKYSSALEESAKAKIALEKQEAINAEAERRHAISLDYEKKLQEARDKTKTIYKTLEREIEKPIYKECVIPQSGVTRLNESAKEFNEIRSGKKIDDKANALNSKRQKALENE